MAALVLELLSSCAATMSKRSAERGAKAVSVSLGYDKIRFIAPVFIGDTLTARYTVEEIDPVAARSRSKVEVIQIHRRTMRWPAPTS